MWLSLSVQLTELHHVAKYLPEAFVGHGCLYLEGFFFYGMFELERPRMEVYGAIDIGPWGTVFQIAFDGAAYFA